MKLLQVSAYILINWTKLISGDFHRNQVKKSSIRDAVGPLLQKSGRQQGQNECFWYQKQLHVQSVLDREISLSEKANFFLICSCLAN